MYQLDHMTIRSTTARDRHALERLAQLDAAHVPTGPGIAAEVDGRLVAFVALDGSATIADPFEPTAEIMGILTLRAAQMRVREVRTRRSGRRARPGVGRRSPSVGT